MDDDAFAPAYELRERLKARESIKRMRRASSLPEPLRPAHKHIIRELARLYAGLPGSGHSAEVQQAITQACDYWQEQRQERPRGAA